jgi:hypothetical protein
MNHIEKCFTFKFCLNIIGVVRSELVSQILHSFNVFEFLVLCIKIKHYLIFIFFKLHIGCGLYLASFISWRGMKQSSLSVRSLNGPLFQPQMMGRNKSAECLAMETEVLGKICPSVALPTTNPKWLDPGSNPSRRRAKPENNRLIYVTAMWPYLSVTCHPHSYTSFHTNMLRYCLIMRMEHNKVPNVCTT